MIPHPKTCPQCQTMIASGLLSCPACHALIYANEIKVLVQEAENFTNDGNALEALIRWRKILELLPPESQQHNIVAQKIDALSKKVDSRALKNADEKKQPMPAALMGLGAIGLLLWKFKFLAVLLFTKGKLLLLGLTKAQTFFSMFLAFGVYWSVWGWKFALGLILSIYVHEMGHVFAIKNLGMPISGPIFIPGVGAFIRLKQGAVTPREDARIGLAGPIAGLGAALFCYAVFLFSGWPSWAAIAKVGAWINLFNLLPFVPLDGGRGFRALTQKQKWIVIAVMGGMWIWTMEGLLILLLLVGIFNALQKTQTEESDQRALIEFCLLVVVLSLMCKIHVSTP